MTPEQYIQLGLDAAAKVCDSWHEFGSIGVKFLLMAEHDVQVATDAANALAKVIRDIDPAKILQQMEAAELRKQNNSGSGE